MRDDETFLSELELWPLVQIQRAAHIQKQVQPSAPEINVKRSAMQPSAARPSARSEAINTQPPPNTDVRKPVPSQAKTELIIDPLRAPKIAALDWLALQNAVSACADCGLCKQRKQAVFGSNNATASTSATWMFVGDAPGLEDDAQGEPFLGEVGQLVDAMLHALGLKRGDQVFLSSAVKCRPPGNRTPTADEIATCLPYLQRQIALVQPKIIIAFGKIAAQALTGLDAPIMQLRGTVHHFNNTAIIATFNSAFLLRNGAEKAKVWDDLLLAKKTLESLN